MSSLKSYFRKKHKYETQSDLKDLTAEQIVNLNPNEVGYYVESETGGIPLEGVKKRALFRLLAIKKQNKATPNEAARQRAITQFLQNEGISSNPEVDKLIINTNRDVMTEQLQMKDLQNRFRKLNNQPIIPDTEEEGIFRRVSSLKAGKKKRNISRKTVTKRKPREKTRKVRRTRRRF
jgi:hypothetical protein